MANVTQEQVFLEGDLLSDPEWLWKQLLDKGRELIRTHKSFSAYITRTPKSPASFTIVVDEHKPTPEFVYQLTPRDEKISPTLTLIYRKE